MAALELSDIDVANLMEITRLHDEAFDHYLANGDCHHKSSEGYVSVGLGNYWDRDTGSAPTCEVYSYVFGPNRNHYFKTIRDALVTVREWHAREMDRDYAAEEAELESFFENGDPDVAAGIDF